MMSINEITDEQLAVTQKMTEFIESSPSVFHAVKTIRDVLDKNRFACLSETDKWDNVHAWDNNNGGNKTAKSFYAVRNDSSIIAWRIGANVTYDNYSLRICASHCDSPTFKLKAKPAIEGPDGYLKLNVEPYGGMINSTWLDRPLSLAGRVVVSSGNTIQTKLVYIDKDILTIPNVAIHMNREANKVFAFNPQVDMLPLASAGVVDENAFMREIASAAQVEPDQVVAFDLSLVNRQKPTIWGIANEFVSAPRLDDLQCAFASLEAFVSSRNDDAITVFACFDNEEVGSTTKQGALSTFLADTLARINNMLGFDDGSLRQAIAKSYLVSCDNAHAKHPNHPEKTDEENYPLINKGVVIKQAANQKYTTDAVSQAVFERICTIAGVPVQHFSNRSDAQGGSTLGNLSNTQVSLNSVDIGLAQLAMHSSFETAGAADTHFAIKALRAFYDAQIDIQNSGSITLNAK